jgi:hypothetical protein
MTKTTTTKTTTEPIPPWKSQKIWASVLGVILVGVLFYFGRTTEAVALAGLGWDGLSAVAPAMLCMAPSAPKVETAAFNTEVAGDARTVSAAVATTRTAGVRWSKAMRSVPGRFNQCRRRREAGENFMGRNEGEKRKRRE